MLALSHFFNMLFEEMLDAHQAHMLSCSSLGVGAWFITQFASKCFGCFQQFFPSRFKFNCFSPLSIVGVSWYVCTQPIDSMGIHLLQCAHGNECTRTSWCNVWHLCIHHSRSWLACGMWTSTCASYTHSQLLSSMNGHCFLKRWGLHLNKYHCNQSYINTLISSIIVLLEVSRL
jgi:hypothetical protein